MYEDYTPLGAKAALTYSAYIPPLTGEPLAVTAEEVKEMFRLLP
jgi:hypothetical protein